MSKPLTDLFWMKNATIQSLNESISENLDRYRTGDFKDLAAEPGWQQKSVLQYDASGCDGLSGTSKQDLEDALIVFGMLKDLPARLATSMNVWVPLAHTALLPYARERWLKLDGSDEQLIESIKTHIFKGGVGGYRDDNVAGRPWWTGYIGSRVARSRDMSKVKVVLTPFMRTTDTRSNVIERSGIFMERGLAKHISDYLVAGRLADSEKEKVFREFMVNINLKSNGRFFGDMNQSEVFAFLDSCH